ncbi:MAG: NUDIX domain-containing protein [Pseudomonadota bacterium]
MAITYSARFKEREYKGFVTLDTYEADVAMGDNTAFMRREVHDHGNGATVLPVDATRKTALLVRQLRMPVHVVEGDGVFLETAAGLIDPEDGSPAEAAQREAAEELGYHLHNLTPVTTAYTIPGLVTEQMHFFLAEYTPADKMDRGPDPDEDEIIIVEEWGLADLWAAFERGEVRDVKATVCLMGLRLRRPELF